MTVTEETPSTVPQLQAVRLPDGSHIPPVETRFKPGQSGNPGGKPKGASTLAPMLRELARNPDEDGYGQQAVEIAKRALQAARDGDGKALSAILALMDRTDGPVEKRIEHSGELTTKRVILERETPSP